MGEKKLKIAINRWAFDAAMPVGECIDLAKQSGYDGIELNLEESGDFSLQTRAKELEGIRRRCAEQGLEISSLCSLLFWKYPCTSSNSQVSSKGMEVIRRMVDFAGFLQVEKILVVPGLVHADPPLNFGNPPEPYEQVYQRAVRCLSELGDYAGSHGVTICAENVYYNKFLLTPVEFKKFLADVGHKNVQMYFDIGNAMLCGFPEHWIEHLGSLIGCIHVKDHESHVPSLYGVRNILAGDVSWDKVAQAISKIRYAGYLVAEPTLFPYRFFPEELIIASARALKRVVELVETSK